MKTWRIQLLTVLVLAVSCYSKEETKKALIISIDELKPEDSDVIISDVTIKDQRSSASYQNTEISPINKQLDYIIVNPEDLKVLKQLEGVTVDEPKIVRYPESGSDESLESTSRYTPYSLKSKKVVSKYPARPAPPLTNYAADDGSIENNTNDKSKPYAYDSYDSPNTSPYKATLSQGINEDVSVNGDSGLGYNTVHSGSPDLKPPSTYIGTFSYSAPGHSYGSSNSSGYSGYSGFRKPIKNIHLYYGGSKPSSYSHPHSYGGSPSSYEAPKPSSYSRPSTYEAPKPSSYSRPSTYKPSKLNSYSESSTYKAPQSISYYKSNAYEPKPTGYFIPPTYGNSKPSSYSGTSSYESLKPNSYTSYYYESPKPGTDTKEQNYENNEPSSYKNTQSYYGSRYRYPKPDLHSSTSSYSSPGKTYSMSHSPSYGPFTHSRPSNSHYDSSSEKMHPKRQKYTLNPQTQEDSYGNHEYSHHKAPSVRPGYERHVHHTPMSYYKEGYLHPSSVKHASNDALPPPYKTPPHEAIYDNSNSEYETDIPDDSPKDYYRDKTEPESRDRYNSPPQKQYYSPYSSYDKDPNSQHHHASVISKPSYGKSYDDDHTLTYNSNPYTESYWTTANPSYSKKTTYDSPKTSYGSSYEPSLSEEPIKANVKYHYPSSRVRYESQSSYKDPGDQSISSKVNDYEISHYDNPTHAKSGFRNGYSTTYASPTLVNNGAKYPSSHSSSGNKNYPYASKGAHDLEYGTRHPATYRKPRHSNSKFPHTSHFTIEDAQSPEQVKEFKNHFKKPTTAESPLHYDDSSKSTDFHSVKKNYSPVRPAPLHDELEQPRYPPLPPLSKTAKDKKYYGSEEMHGKDTSESYEHEYNNKDKEHYKHGSYNGESSYKTPYSDSSSEKHYPSSSENKNYHYSDHSSEETDKPLVYTKTITYTKTNKDSEDENTYASDKLSPPSYTTPSGEYSRIKENRDNGKDFVISQPEYSRPKYNEKRFPSKYSHSYSYKGKPGKNASLPESYSSLSKNVPPKRVEGVVYRSRQFYPHVKSYRKYNGYLPYKHHYPKSTSAYDYKPYESNPSEIRAKNMTKYSLTYRSPQKNSQTIKLPRKKDNSYSSSESDDFLESYNDHSNHDAIPGQPGKDYPVLKQIPHTRFSCEGKHPGFYADVENRCQVYYQCSEEGRVQSFLCPNGTIFNQLTFVCEWWHNVDCSKSEKYFSNNNELYKTKSDSPTSYKTKRTTDDNYTRSRPGMRSNHDTSSLYTNEGEFHNQEKASISS